MWGYTSWSNIILRAGTSLGPHCRWGGRTGALSETCRTVVTVAYSAYSGSERAGQEAFHSRCFYSHNLRWHCQFQSLVASTTISPSFAPSNIVTCFAKRLTRRQITFRRLSFPRLRRSVNFFLNTALYCLHCCRRLLQPQSLGFFGS